MITKQASTPTGSRSRTAWRVAGTLIAVLMLTFGTANVVAAFAHDTWRVHRVIGGSVRVVDVVTSGGSITIVGGSASSAVTVDMTVSRGLETPTHSETVEGDQLVLRNHCGWLLSSWCQVDYVLHVPSSVSVLAHSDGGNVTVSNVRGDLELASSGGDISARNVVASRVRLDSDGGDVTADGLSARTIEASTNGGDVSLVLDTPPTRSRPRRTAETSTSRSRTHPTPTA